jgi:hypothetical protein
LGIFDRQSRADPPVAPQPGVKGFDVTAQLTPVAGFGNAVQPAASEKRHRDHPGRTVDAQASPPPKSSEIAQKSQPAPSPIRSYRFRSPYERSSFPSGVPEWFKLRDADFDGQVFMWEYASSWSDESAQAFRRLDVNGDGVITARESVGRREVAVEPIRAASHVRPNQVPAISKASVAAAAVSPAPASATPAEEPAVAALVRTPLAAAHGPLPHAIPQSFVAYADGVIQRFDADRDGALTAAEWTAMPAAPATADADGNGRITASELAVWYITKR